MKSKIQRGDVYYADLRPVIGCEQGGIRPVLIVQNNAGNQHSPTVIAAAITSRRKHRLPTHIPVRERTKGLKQNSVILLEQIRTLDRKRLRDYIGQVNTMTMQEVDQAIAVSFGLDGFLTQNRESKEQQGRTGMKQKRLAWIYCAIDAPEDTHGALKEQLKALRLCGTDGNGDSLK